MRDIEKRVARLEAANPEPSQARPFLWFAGRSLVEALTIKGLSLDDENLMVIEIVGHNPCPVHERDRHLLG